MLITAPLSFLLYLPYYLILFGGLATYGARMWIVHVAWYTAIASVQAWLAIKCLGRRRPDKSAA